MSSFKDLRIVDNFYQTSAFYPMPTVCISTVNPDGSLNINNSNIYLRWNGLIGIDISGK